MRLPGLALMVLALLLPSVSAGSEQDPEISDPRDQREGWKDILAVWFEDHPDGVKFTIKVASLPAPRPGTLYVVEWAGASDANVAIGFDGTRSLRSGVDTPNGWTSQEGARGRLDDGLIDESFRPGSPAYLSGVIPAARFGLEQGDALRRLNARTVFDDESGSDWPTGDSAGGAATFTIGAGGGFFPILVPAWVLPTIVIGCVAGGMGAGLAIARRKPAAKTIQVASAVPVRTAPPPGQRFQRAPPTRKP